MSESARLNPQGMYLNNKYIDIIEKRVQEDKRNASEIIDDIINKHGLKVIK